MRCDDVCFMTFDSTSTSGLLRLCDSIKLLASFSGTSFQLKDHLQVGFIQTQPVLDGPTMTNCAPIQVARLSLPNCPQSWLQM